QFEISPPPVVVALARRVVGRGTGAGAGRGKVLPPEQELDRVPAGGDVALVAHLVALVDGEERDRDGRVVDDAGVRLAGDVVEEGLVERPGIEAALDVLDRAVIEAEGFRDEIGRAGGDPGRARRGELLSGRIGEEGGDRLLHPLRRGRGRDVAPVDAFGVGGDLGPGVVGKGSAARKRVTFRREAAFAAALAAFTARGKEQERSCRRNRGAGFHQRGLAALRRGRRQRRKRRSRQRKNADAQPGLRAFLHCALFFKTGRSSQNTEGLSSQNNWFTDHNYRANSE